jgi:starch synthase
MNILLASAEVDPYAKRGGLADIAASLPAEWQKYGQNPIIIMPKYGFIDTHYYGFKPTYLVLYVPIVIGLNLDIFGMEHFQILMFCLFD